MSAYILILQLLTSTVNWFLTSNRFILNLSRLVSFFSVLLVGKVQQALEKLTEIQREGMHESLPFLDIWLINAASNYALSICVLLYRSEGESSRSIRYVYIVFFLS